jgi:hypothetical protein
MESAVPLDTAEAVRARIDDAVAAAFRAATAARARPPHSFSMSRLGLCTRASAYALAGTPISDTPELEEGRASNLGTWEHEGLLPYLAAELGVDAGTEVPVELHAAGLIIPGRADITAIHELGDLKTTGEHKLHKARRRNTCRPDHWVQAAGYALGRRQAGHDVHWLIIIYLDRATGDHETFVEPFDDAAALAVIDRVREIRRWADTDPDRAPRAGYARPWVDERAPRYDGPGLGAPDAPGACDGCSWLRRCWGPTAVPGRVGAQRLKRTDRPAIEAALRLYDDATATISPAERDKDFAAAQLENVRPDVYGSMSLRWGAGGQHMDQAAVRAHYAELGLPVPMSPTRGSLLVRRASRLTPKMRREIEAAAGDE